MKDALLKLIKFLLIIMIGQMIIFILLIGCAAHANLEPLGKGEVDASVSLGGPFIPLAETKIPTPYLVAGANYGVAKNINIDGSLHITSLFYQIAGFDLGATWFPVMNEGLIPTWGIQPRFLVLSSFKSDVKSRLRIYPLISNSTAWKWGEGLFYTGLDFTIPLTKPDFDDEAKSIIFSPFFGYRWELGKKLRLLSEVKWHGANIQGNQLAVEYITIGGYGAVSLMLTLERRF